MPKVNNKARERLAPLHMQLHNDAKITQRAPKAAKPITENQGLDQKTTKKILKMARDQQLELNPENDPFDSDVEDINPDFEELEDDDEDIQEQHVQEFEPIDLQEQALLAKFMGKPREKLELGPMAEEVDEADKMNPKVIEVYTKVGILLSRYKSGPLPKIFKIIPTLRDWEEVLYLTNPEAWTPQAMYEATRIFTSNLKSKMAQRFFSMILLERVRDDINETKKLNYHLYMAVKKSLYKPAAFFKGFLLPLCESGTCTLREAAILSSVLVKVSVPVLHSAAALLKLAEMEYTGPNSLFIRVLLDKKYALPFKVVDALVFHFLSFKNDEREMPVLWHQSLLVFCQRYKQDVTAEQKAALMDLVKHKFHFGITEEIRRELINSCCRGEEDVEMTIAK